MLYLNINKHFDLIVENSDNVRLIFNFYHNILILGHCLEKLLHPSTNLRSRFLATFRAQQTFLWIGHSCAQEFAGHLAPSFPRPHFALVQSIGIASQVPMNKKIEKSKFIFLEFLQKLGLNFTVSMCH